MEDLIQEKLNAIIKINEEKDNAERAIETLSAERVSAYDLIILFMRMPEEHKRLILEQYYQKQRLELIGNAKELMKNERRRTKK